MVAFLSLLSSPHDSHLACKRDKEASLESGTNNWKKAKLRNDAQTNKLRLQVSCVMPFKNQNQIKSVFAGSL